VIPNNQNWFEGIWRGLWKGDTTPVLPLAQTTHLALEWGRLNLQRVIRYPPKAPVFVHCHECRWPVSPMRTHMATGAGFYADGSNALPATEDQMQRICEGVRRHMEVA
jgi:hypothetical protein